MIENVVKECRVFLLLSFSVLFGFSLALYVLYGSVIDGDNGESDTENSALGSSSNEDRDKSNDVREAFGTFQGSLLSMFFAMVGMLDAAVRYAQIITVMRRLCVALLLQEQTVLDDQGNIRCLHDCSNDCLAQSPDCHHERHIR